ncbi:polysaccharide biosynthesis C-terminal domain-containing protein [Vibrio cyclitrophicus]|uniref:oligosaccharide flippase family protein n=1 Tax=Vibrio cyclitrophicus TaxID=47951 RepID=UPI0035A6A596
MKIGILKKIFANDNYIEILKGAGLAFFLKLFGALVSFLLTLVIARRLGASDSGYYFFIISTLLFCSSLSSFGLFNAVLKEASINFDDRGYLSSIMSKSLVVVIFGCCLVASIFFIYEQSKDFIGLSHYIIDRYSFFIVLALLPFTLTFIFSSYFQANRKIFLSMLMLNIGYQSLMLAGITIFSVSSLDELLAVFLASLIFIVLLAFTVYFITDGNKLSFSGGISFSSLMVLSLPMMVSHVVSQINVFSGQFFLSIYTTPEDISLFSVSLRIATLMSFLVVAVNRISAPKFAILYKNNEIDELSKVVVFSNRILFLFCFPILIFVVFFGRKLLGYFGSDFTDAYYVLIILIFGQFISSISGTVVFLLQMTGLQRELRNNVIIATILSVLLGWFLVPVYGVIGAAIMTFVSLSVTNLFSCYRAYKILGINPLKIF